MTTTYGTYYDTLPDGRVLIASPLPDGADETEVRLIWQDQEEITAEQRKKIFAICREIADWSAHDPEYVRKNLTADFLRANIERLQMSALSLAISGNCDKGTASLFIEFLVDFCLENDVPTSRPLQEYADDQERYTYSALLHKRCLICGKKADLHHVDQVGLGYNRNTKPQLGALVMPLCREHHSEYHSIGDTAFGEKYHVFPVPLDKRIAQKYHISGKAAS
jgi:hypothetical protein